MFDFLLGNDLLSSILAFVIVLIPAVIVHELGHFLAARAVGITVLEFGIGFPPRMARLFMWRETEFTLNWIPLGGFVRPFGEDVIQQSDSQSQDEDAGSADYTSRYNDDPLQGERQVLARRGVENPVSVYDVKPLPRIFFMVAGALMNFLFALVVFVLIGFAGIPEEVGVRFGIAGFEPESPISQAGLQQDDWITEVNGEWITSADQFVETLQASIGQNVSLGLRRLQEDDSFATETINVEVTPAFAETWASAGSYVRVAGVAEGSPADRAGLQPDDLIFAFNGETIQDSVDPSTQLQQLSDAAAGEVVTLSVLRDGESLDLELTPRANPPPGEGRIGINIRSELTTPDDSLVFVLAPQVDYIPQAAGPSISYGLESTLDVFQQIAEFPARLIQGATEPGETRVISAVGVSELGGVVLQESIRENNVSVFLRYIALISIALGFTNLLPIPALDGGRIVFAVIELVRGKPISPEREGYVHMIGLLFLLSLGVLLIINDLVNPVSELLQ
ncbi:MAG: RIP metalloprotease RseP [Phototrophicaceae bacterium]